MSVRKSGASRGGARKAASAAAKRAHSLAPEPTHWAPAAAAAAREASLHALLAVAADYYWEQDADYRFTVWRPTAERSNSLDARAFLGKTSADACPAPGDDPTHWVTHRARLEAREAFRDVLHELPAGDGSSRQLHLSGAPLYGAAGDFLGYRGVARDAGALSKLEKLLAFEGALVRGLGEADDLASAVPLVLKLTCEFGRFTCGSC